MPGCRWTESDGVDDAHTHHSGAEWKNEWIFVVKWQPKSYHTQWLYWMLIATLIIMETGVNTRNNSNGYRVRKQNVVSYWSWSSHVVESRVLYQTCSEHACNVTWCNVNNAPFNVHVTTHVTTLINVILSNKWTPLILCCVSSLIFFHKVIFKEMYKKMNNNQYVWYEKCTILVIRCILIALINININKFDNSTVQDWFESSISEFYYCWRRFLSEMGLFVSVITMLLFVLVTISFRLFL